MGFFRKVEGESAIIQTGGVFRDAALYIRDGMIYAGYGAGYIRLLADRSTSKPKTQLAFMSWHGNLCRNKLGYLCTSAAADATPLAPERAALMLASPEEGEGDRHEIHG